MLDTKGPEIRLGFFKEEPVYLEQGARVTLTTEVIKGGQGAYSRYLRQPARGDIRKGDTILLGRRLNRA